jgi:uncharacterized membrane protein YqaE (UPF0057 family)
MSNYCNFLEIFLKKVFFYLWAHFGGHFFIPRGCFPVVAGRSDIDVRAAGVAPGSTAINFGSIDINFGSTDRDSRPTDKEFCCTEIASASTDGHFGSSEFVPGFLDIGLGSAVLKLHSYFFLIPDFCLTALGFIPGNFYWFFVITDCGLFFIVISAFA